MILVIDNNIEKRMKSYGEQYKLFYADEDQKALAHARSCGAVDTPLGGPWVPSKSGHAFQYKCGEVDVMILRLEVQSGK
jgi:hypothetical protein